MTKETVLKKAIKKAVKNGWKEDVHFSYLEDGELVKVHHIGLGETTPNVYSIIFSHDFAKAFFPKKLEHSCKSDRSGGGVCGCCAYVDDHLWHLQQMVLEKDPIKYLEKFLFYLKHKHRVKLEIPPKDVVTITIGGYTFFRGTDANQLQCTTCLCLMGMQVIGNKIKGKVRRVKVIKDCDCPPQK